MQRAFRYRLYPSKAQKLLLESELSVCRTLYNLMLSLNNEVWKKHKHSLIFEFQKIIKYLKIYNEDLQLTSVHSSVLQDTCDRVTSSFLGFFRRLKEYREKKARGEKAEKPGFPRFKGEHRYDSLNFSNTAAGVLENDRLRLSKVGPVKIRMHQQLPEGAKLLNVTVRRTASGKWYASLACEIPDNPSKKLPKTGKEEGIDLGITNFIVTSEKDEEKSAKRGYPCGKTIKKPNHLRNNLVKLRKLQKKFSKAKKGSKKRKALGQQLSRLHEKIANQRHDWLHKTSREMINTYDTICVEDLAVKRMMKHDKEAEKDLDPKDKKNARGMRRNIGDCSWSTFTFMLTYKAEEAGRTIRLVNPRNTTKACSECQTLVPKDTSVRVHMCQKCGLVMDRDFNASLNVKNYGLGTSPWA